MLVPGGTAGYIAVPVLLPKIKQPRSPRCTICHRHDVARSRSSASGKQRPHLTASGGDSGDDDDDNDDDDDDDGEVSVGDLPTFCTCTR